MCVSARQFPKTNMKGPEEDEPHTLATLIRILRSEHSGFYELSRDSPRDLTDIYKISECANGLQGYSSQGMY